MTTATKLRRRNLERRARLRRATGLRRRTRLRPRSVRVRMRVRAPAFGLQAALCRMLPCSVAGCMAARCDPHHDPPRPVGTDENTCPLCREHHELFHGRVGTGGRRWFQRVYGLDTRLVVVEVRAFVVWARESAGFDWTEETTVATVAVVNEWKRRRETFPSKEVRRAA